MTLVLPDAAEDLILQHFFNKTAPQNQTLKLFKSNTTPGEGDTAATYTVADFTGYANISLTGADWTITPGAPTAAAAPQQTFSSSADQAAQSVYGYYVVQAVSGLLMFAERFTDGPYVIANNGDQIKITPQFTMA